MCFLPCPSMQKTFFDSDTVWMTHAKIDQNKFTFSQISHLSSNRRVHNLTFYFQFTTPARELTHKMKFEYPERHEFQNTMFLHYLSQRNTKNPTQKDMNFGNTIILCYLEPENCQNQLRKTQISHQTALIDPSKNAKESFRFSRILHIVSKCTH